MDTTIDPDLFSYARAHGFAVNDRAGTCARSGERIGTRRGYTRDGETYSVLATAAIAYNEREDAMRDWQRTGAAATQRSAPTSRDGRRAAGCTWARAPNPRP